MVLNPTVAAIRKQDAIGPDSAEARWDYSFTTVHRVPPGPRSAGVAVFACGASGAGSTAVRDMEAEIVRISRCGACFPK